MTHQNSLCATLSSNKHGEGEVKFLNTSSLFSACFGTLLDLLARCRHLYWNSVEPSVGLCLPDRADQYKCIWCHFSVAIILLDLPYCVKKQSEVNL